MSGFSLKVTAWLQVAFGILLTVFSAALLMGYRSLTNVQSVEEALDAYTRSVTDAKHLVSTTLDSGKMIADELPKNLDDFAQSADDTAKFIHYVPVPTKSTEQALQGSAVTLRKTARSIRTDLRPSLDTFEKSFAPSCDKTIEMLKAARSSASTGSRTMWLIGLVSLCVGIVVTVNGISLLLLIRPGM